ncbi:MAG TPA: hypothetical protein VMT85_10060 [Thermoanaerobaculia bacterium]|nr:hypothetical protein [Thermoanaerobaculia bacterium]
MDTAKRRRPWIALAIALTQLAGLAPAAGAQGLAALREIEVGLLAKRFADYETAAERERAATQELRQTLDRLNSMIGDGDVTVETLRQLEADVSLAREAAYLRARETTDLRLELYGRMERIEALDQVLGIGAGVLSGEWSIDLGPDEGAGRVTFNTYGDRVEGRYEMADGDRGTLLGTLVDGRLELERIANDRGRDLRLVAGVSEGGRRLSGSWQRFELASGRRTEGTWTGRKIDSP